jgi:hypothetical protein
MDTWNASSKQKTEMSALKTVLHKKNKTYTPKKTDVKEYKCISTNSIESPYKSHEKQKGDNQYRK